MFFLVFGLLKSDITFSASFEDAIQKACTSASDGDYVLLSPGCASLDLFSSYVERGILFEQLVHRIAK